MSESQSAETAGRSCTCETYVVDYSDPERYHPENLDREDDPNCPVHGDVYDDGPCGCDVSHPRFCAWNGACCDDCSHDTTWEARRECEHQWLDRPESDTHECLICGVEGSGPPPRTPSGSPERW